MGQTTTSNKQSIKNHYSLIGQLNIDFYRKLIAIQTFSGVTATEFDINKKKKKFQTDPHRFAPMICMHSALP